jgi:hypothetical protein
MKKGLVWVIVAVVVAVLAGFYYKGVTAKPVPGVAGKIISNPGYIFDHAAHHGGGGGF